MELAEFKYLNGALEDLDYDESLEVTGGDLSIIIGAIGAITGIGGIVYSIMSGPPGGCNCAPCPTCNPPDDRVGAYAGRRP